MRFLIAILASATLLSAQTAPYAPKQSDRPEVLTVDEPGFQAIFDGKIARRLGRQSDLLACRERSARRRNHARRLSSRATPSSSGGAARRPTSS